MISKLLASAAFGMLVLGAAGNANAAPGLGAGLTVANSGPQLEKVWWRRVCDRDGDRCRSVWVRGDRDHDEHRGWGWRKVCDHDGDRCRMVRRDRD